MTLVQRARIAMLAFLLAFVALPTTMVFADGSPPPSVNADTTNVSTFVVAAPVMTLIVSLIIPVIVGFVSKASWPGQVKGIIDIILNAIWGVIAAGQLADGSAAFSSTAVFTAILGCLISLAAYLKVYKPMNLTSNPGGKLANVGVK